MPIPSGLTGQTCTVYPYLREGAGETLYGEAEGRLARFEPAPGIRSVHLDLGGAVEQVPVRGTLFLQGGVIPVGSLVEIGGVRMRALCVRPCFGLRLCHVEVDVG